jgi:hypothetical protein
MLGEERKSRYGKISEGKIKKKRLKIKELKRLESKIGKEMLITFEIIYLYGIGLLDIEESQCR